MFSISESGKYRTESIPSARGGVKSHWILFKRDDPVIFVAADGFINYKSSITTGGIMDPCPIPGQGGS